jgi:hypothetical protein
VQQKADSKVDGASPFTRTRKGFDFDGFERGTMERTNNGSLSSHNSRAKVICTCKNTVNRTGKADVQFYIKPPFEGPVAEPYKKPKTFKKVEIGAGAPRVLWSSFIGMLRASTTLRWHFSKC